MFVFACGVVVGVVFSSFFRSKFDSVVSFFKSRFSSSDSTPKA